MKTHSQTILSYRLMRLSALFQSTRNLGIAINKFKTRPETRKIFNPGFEIDSDQLLNDIRYKGFSEKFSISANHLDDIRKACKDFTFKADRTEIDHKIDIDNPIKPSDDILYINTSIYQQSEAVRNLAHDNSIVEVAKNYLGVEPEVMNVRSFWSFPAGNEGYRHEYGWHYDIDALKFLKLFVYLTDVDEDCGPHVIIEDTHKKKSFYQKRNRRLTDEQLARQFDPKNINVMLGKAGEAFFEDTFSYHKGTAPQKPRLLLQVEYSI